MAVDSDLLAGEAEDVGVVADLEPRAFGLAGVLAVCGVGEVTLSTDLAAGAAVGVVADLEPNELALAGVLEGTLSLAAVGAFPDVGDVGATASSADFATAAGATATSSADLATVAAGVATSSAALAAALAIFPSTTADVVTGAWTVTVLFVGL